MQEVRSRPRHLSRRKHPFLSSPVIKPYHYTSSKLEIYACFHIDGQVSEKIRMEQLRAGNVEHHASTGAPGTRIITWPKRFLPSDAKFDTRLTSLNGVAMSRMPWLQASCALHSGILYCPC